jgi:hypothetical protein
MPPAQKEHETPRTDQAPPSKNASEPDESAARTDGGTGCQAGRRVPGRKPAGGQDRQAGGGGEGFNGETRATGGSRSGGTQAAEWLRFVLPLSPSLFYRALGGLEECSTRGVVYIAKIYNPTAKAKRRAGISEASR